MAAGATLYSDISARVADIREDSVAVARSANLLAPTILTMSETGLAPRKVDIYSAATWVQRGEDDEMVAQKFNKSAKSTITPYQFASAFRITDARAATDYDGVMADAALELGGAAGQYVDEAIASIWDDAVITGGTIGSGVGSTITWSNIASAQAILSAAKIPPGAPIYCALHPYQWKVLYSSATIAGATIAAVQPNWQDSLSRSNTYFQSPAYAGITFIVTNAIQVTSGTVGWGCMYVPQAFALDTRKAFGIEPKRLAEREATELHATMWFGVGAWRPEWAVCLEFNAATPT
jgi:hypothetical protein